LQEARGVLSTISPSELDTENLKAYDASVASLLEAISAHVSVVRKDKHLALIERLFAGVSPGKGLSPWFLPPLSRRALLDLILHFVVSGSLANTALDFLVRSFSPPGGPGALGERERAWVKDKRELTGVMEEVKKAVLSCLRMAPTLHEEIVGLLLSNWPNKYADLLRSECYVTICFGLALGPLKYAANRIIGCAIDLLVELDIEIKWDSPAMVDLGSPFSPALEESPGQQEAASALSLGESKEENEDFDELDEAEVFEICTVQESAQTPPKKGHNATARNGVQVADPNADKLDVLMKIVLLYIKAAHDEGDGVPAHEVLLNSFQRSIFPVYKTRLTQLLLFYSCSRQPSCKKFVALLSSIYLNHSNVEEAKISAVTYLGSLVARADSLPFNIAFEVITLIGNWCIHFYQLHHREGAAPHAKPEGLQLFFASYQALLQAFTFVIGATSEMANQRLLGGLCNSCLLQVCTHWSNPLSLCSPIVVEDFVQQSLHYKLLNLEAATKLRQMHGQKAIHSHSETANFPFNLYNMKGSSCFIVSQSMYRSQVPRSNPHDESEHARDAQFKAGSVGTYLSESPSTGLEIAGSYFSEEGDLMQYSGNSTVREAWFQGNQRPIPIGAKAQELVQTKYGFGGSFGGSPGNPGSMSTDHSPSGHSLSLGTSLNDNKMKHFFNYKKF
jgi:hypothetical protein